MQKNHSVSIIIPVRAINDYIRESIPKMLELDWSNFEILIFPDEADKKHTWPKTRVIASGKVGPAEKRDLALKYATGEILAFLDDDAYPRSDWLKKMIPSFKKEKVGAVGGPAITPKDDGILQKVSGAIFESILGGGFTRNRYLSIGKVSEVDDWPTVNLLIKKDAFAKVGGFNCAYWPGEDTKLCLDILNAGYRILYNPSGIVYHHRRSDLLKHFKQIGNYALHRGYFAKVYPKTSCKFYFFVPSLFDLYLIVVAIFFIINQTQSWLNNNPNVSQLLTIARFPLIVYSLLLFLDSIIVSWRWRNLFIGLITIPMIFLTHIWYGFRFVQGLLTKKLER